MSALLKYATAPVTGMLSGTELQDASMSEFAWSVVFVSAGFLSPFRRADLPRPANAFAAEHFGSGALLPGGVRFRMQTSRPSTTFATAAASLGRPAKWSSGADTAKPDRCCCRPFRRSTRSVRAAPACCPSVLNRHRLQRRRAERAVLSIVAARNWPQHQNQRKRDHHPRHGDRGYLRNTQVTGKPRKKITH